VGLLAVALAGLTAFEVAWVGQRGKEPRLLPPENKRKES
jgi:hypothetical protein